MDKKVKIIIALVGVLVLMGFFALNPFAEGLQGALRFFNQPVTPVLDVIPDRIQVQPLNTHVNSPILGIASSNSMVLDDFFYIDRYDFDVETPESPYEPYDLPGVFELVDRNFELIYGAGIGPEDFAPKKTYKVAVAYVDFDFEDEFYVFSKEEQEMLEKLKDNLPSVFGYATNYQAGLDTTYEVKKIFVPEEHGFDIMYDWLAGDTASTVSKIFYENNPDEFDFVFIFGKHIGGMSRFFPVQEETKGKGCKNSYGYEVKGESKCEECFNHSADFGSSGKLKGVILMSVGGTSTSQSLFDPSTCAAGMWAGAPGTMMSDVHSFYNDYAACDSALQSLDAKIDAPYLYLSLMLHEIEHYWGFSVFPYDEDLFFENLANFPQNVREMLLKFESLGYRSHFRYAVEGEESVDPLGAVQFEWLVDANSFEEMAKVCLQDLYPYKPLKFHPMIMHMMGFDQGLDMSKSYKAMNVWGNDTGSSMELVKWEKDCVYLKPSSKSRESSVSVQDIVDFWGPVEMCS